MRIGILGCGYWGSKHVRVMHGLGEVEQVAIIDPRIDRREELCNTFPSLLSFATLDAALPHVDALVVATPPSTHTELALIAMRAGKHVLVEKPLTTSVDDALRLLEEAERSDTVLMVGHTFEYNAAVVALKAIISSGEIGRLHYIDTARLNLGQYQASINVVWDLAPHDISIVNYLLDATPDTVTAWGDSHAHAFLEDVAYIRLEYRSLNVTAQIHVSWLDPCKVRRVTVVGSQKMVVYNDLASEERLRIYDKGVEPPDEWGGAMHDVPASYRHGGIHSPYVPFEEPLQVQARHFADCVATRRRPLSDGRNGLAVVEVLAAAERSLRERRTVELTGIPATA